MRAKHILALVMATVVAAQLNFRPASDLMGSIATGAFIGALWAAAPAMEWKGSYQVDIKPYGYALGLVGGVAGAVIGPIYTAFHRG